MAAESRLIYGVKDPILIQEGFKEFLEAAKTHFNFGTQVEIDKYSFSVDIYVKTKRLAKVDETKEEVEYPLITTVRVTQPVAKNPVSEEAQMIMRYLFIQNKNTSLL